MSMFDVVVLWLQMAELEKRLAELETAVGSGSDKQVEHCQKKKTLFSEPLRRTCFHPSYSACFDAAQKL